jgi:hypothetical protein
MLPCSRGSCWDRYRAVATFSPDDSRGGAYDEFTAIACAANIGAVRASAVCFLFVAQLKRLIRLTPRRASPSKIYARARGRASQSSTRAVNIPRLRPRQTGPGHRPRGPWPRSWRRRVRPRPGRRFRPAWPRPRSPAGLYRGPIGPPRRVHRRCAGVRWHAGMLGRDRSLECSSLILASRSASRRWCSKSH